MVAQVALHVDDFLHAGEELFKSTVSKKLSEVFKMGKTEEKKFKYVGFNIEQKKNGIIIDMKDYADEKIELFNVFPDRSKDQDADLS